LLPLGFIVAYAFARTTGFFEVTFGVSFVNFQRLWDPLYLRIYRDTFAMSLGGTLGCW
jgi:ABC-type spermidine/putrescine transport system permease subunit I